MVPGCLRDEPKMNINFVRWSTTLNNGFDYVVSLPAPVHSHWAAESHHILQALLGSDEAMDSMTSCTRTALPAYEIMAARYGRLQVSHKRDTLRWWNGDVEQNPI